MTQTDTLEFVNDHDDKYIALWHMLYHYFSQDKKLNRTGIVDIIHKGKLSRFKMQIKIEQVKYSETAEIARLKRCLRKC